MDSGAGSLAEARTDFCSADAAEALNCDTSRPPMTVCGFDLGQWVQQNTWKVSQETPILTDFLNIKHTALKGLRTLQQRVVGVGEHHQQQRQGLPAWKRMPARTFH